jgi:8-oxo-dGTP pyrophosphatase MutT (NUDIX family)
MSPQSAAIPYTMDGDGTVRVLLVTSRTRRRWIIPKGKVGARMLPGRSAGREAFEEAGVLGRIHKEPLGSYQQRVDPAFEGGETYTVHAFAMKVTDELDVWQEMHVRDRRWFTVNGALQVVRDVEIRKLLRTFDRWIRVSERKADSSGE